MREGIPQLSRTCLLCEHVVKYEKKMHVMRKKGLLQACSEKKEKMLAVRGILK
jgi:hypothetical protein